MAAVEGEDNSAGLVQGLVTRLHLAIQVPWSQVQVLF